MDLNIVWISILSSLALGLAGVCLFIFAIKKDYFRNIEDAKYQVFWSDLDEPGNDFLEQEKDGKEE
jgi:hypothetical protein